MLHTTLYKNCSLYISANCLTIGLGLTEIFLVHHTVNLKGILYCVFNNVNMSYKDVFTDCFYECSETCMFVKQFCKCRTKIKVKKGDSLPFLMTIEYLNLKFKDNFKSIVSIGTPLI